tara:strand:+ start:38264 stop:39724 length:1461 start_codon:yes stop_codon:yes gene_type:complete
MTFFIGNTQIDDSLNSEQWLKATMALPAPQIHDYRAKQVQPHQVALCVQREILHTRITNHSPLYLGTVSATSCISAFLFSPSHAAIIHIDNTYNFDLPRLLSHFNKTEQIQVILLGGEPNNPLSKSHVKAILTALHQQATSGFHITIKHAYLCEKNKFLATSEAQFYFNKLLKKLSWLYYKLYKKPLPLSAFQWHSIEDFKRAIKQTAATKQSLMAFIGLLVSSSTINNTATADKRDFCMRICKIDSEERFMQYAHATFSKPGHDLLCNAYTQQLGTGLENYAFDIKTGNVIEIPDYWPMPYSAERWVAPYDRFKAKFEYHLLEAGKELKPIFSKQFNLHTNTWRSFFITTDVCDTAITYPRVCYDFLEDRHSNLIFVEYLYAYILQQAAPGFDYSCISNHFLQAYLAKEHSQLRALRELTQCAVTWQLSSDYKLDAIIHLSSQVTMSNTLGSLRQRGYTTCQQKTNDIDGSETIVIQSINEKPYA